MVWWPGRPPPQSRPGGHPQIALMVFIQSADRPAETAWFVAIYLAVSDRAESAPLMRPHPNCSFAILNERTDAQPGHFWVLAELAVLPTGETLPGANPQGSVARNQELGDATEDVISV